MPYELKLFTGNMSKGGFAPLRAVPQKPTALAKPALETTSVSFANVCQFFRAPSGRFERGLRPRNPRGRFGRGTQSPSEDNRCRMS
jgi:hypothetical protein